MTSFYCFILVCFIIVVFICDLFIRKSKQYQAAIRNKTKPRRKLLIKRWWVWLIIVFLAFLMIIGNSSEDDDSEDSNTAKTEETHKSPHKHSKKGSVKEHKANKPKTKKTHKQNTQQHKKQKMLRILNMWASHNNEYGTVKIDDENCPILILNDETVASPKSELEHIVVQFANKIRAQKQLYHIELDNPAVYDKDGTPIAVWNGATLELVHK